MTAEPHQSKPQNRSLRRKQAARMAAVHALYSNHFNPEDGDVSVDELADHLMEEQRESEEDGDDERALSDIPERALLVTLLESAQAREPAIRELIEGAMTSGWNYERLGPLLESILFIAIAELLAKADKKPRIIIDEYLTLASLYFDEEEVGFVHALLDSVSKKTHG